MKRKPHYTCRNGENGELEPGVVNTKPNFCCLTGFLFYCQFKLLSNIRYLRLRKQTKHRAVEKISFVYSTDGTGLMVSVNNVAFNIGKYHRISYIFYKSLKGDVVGKRR